MSNFEDTLRKREIHPDDWYWITPEERDAIVDALGTLREIAGMGEGWLTTSDLAKTALSQLDGLGSE
jgi:hypothetical protein